jgi:hypothetical protein
MHEAGKKFVISYALVTYDLVHITAVNRRRLQEIEGSSFGRICLHEVIMVGVLFDCYCD